MPSTITMTRLSESFHYKDIYMYIIQRLQQQQSPQVSEIVHYAVVMYVEGRRPEYILCSRIQSVDSCCRINGVKISLKLCKKRYCQLYHGRLNRAVM